MMTCATHDIPLVEEPGGAEWPTLYGRIYCPACQRDFVRALDQATVFIPSGIVRRPGRPVRRNERSAWPWRPPPIRNFDY